MQKYISTRDDSTFVSSKQAILNGISPDGGLYVWPELDQVKIDLEKICGQTYLENAIYILSFLLQDYTQEQLEACVNKAYKDSFSKKEITPLKKVGDIYVLELF